LLDCARPQKLSQGQKAHGDDFRQLTLLVMFA